MSVKKFLTPFASSGDRSAIPDGIQTDGSVSYTEGWGFNYQRDPTTDPLAKNVDRGATNQILYDITAGLGQLQTQGAPDWITAAENGGVAYAYPMHAMVRYNNLAWVSLSDNNIAVPGTDDTKWTSVYAKATTERPGSIRIATTAETRSGTASDLAVSPDDLRKTGLRSAAVTTLTVSGNINALLAGQTLLLFASSAQTATLPLLSGSLPGDRFEFLNVGAATWSVGASGTDSIVVNGSGPKSSISVGNGDSLTLLNSGSAWIAVGGSVQMGTSSATFSWQGSGGVNYQPLPNGLILNFGNVPYISAASSVTVTFPCAYISNPISAFTANPYAVDSTAPILVTGFQWVDKTKFIIRNNGTNAAGGVSWFAIGR